MEKMQYVDKVLSEELVFMKETEENLEKLSSDLIEIEPLCLDAISK